MYNPPNCKGILDEIPYQFQDKEKKKNNHLSKSVYMESNRERLFPDSEPKEKSVNTSMALEIEKYAKNNGINYSIKVNKKNNVKSHHKVPDTPATRDNMTQIFKSSVNAQAKEPKITPKINHDDFATFSSTAREINQERYKFE